MLHLKVVAEMRMTGNLVEKPGIAHSNNTSFEFPAKINEEVPVETWKVVEVFVNAFVNNRLERIIELPAMRGKLLLDKVIYEAPV